MGSPEATATATATAWRWVVETLADTKELETSALTEIVSLNAALLKDSASERLVERISLRYLEELVDCGSGATSPERGVDAPAVERWDLDVGMRSEDVLCTYLKKLTRMQSISLRSADSLCTYVKKVKELTKIGSTENAAYKDEIHRFIAEKRETLPKSPLSLLLDCIQKPCHESNPSLTQNDLLSKEVPADVDSLHNESDNGYTGAEMLKLGTHELSNGGVPSRNGSYGGLPRVNGLDTSFGYEEDMADTVGGEHAQPEKVSSDILIPPDSKDNQIHGTTSSGSKNLHPVSQQCSSSDHKGGGDSINEDGSHDEDCVYDSYHEILAAEKDKLISSQIPFNGDSLNETGTQCQLCVKCDEGGSLLLCSANDCPIAVHEHCLGVAAKFEEGGDFYCPFCLYLQAAKAYHGARKKVVSCRKALSSFMGSDATNKNNAAQPEALEGPSTKNVQKGHEGNGKRKGEHVIQENEKKRRVKDVGNGCDGVLRFNKDTLVSNRNNNSSEDINNQTVDMPKDTFPSKKHAIINNKGGKSGVEDDHHEDDVSRKQDGGDGSNIHHEKDVNDHVQPAKVCSTRANCSLPSKEVGTASPDGCAKVIKEVIKLPDRELHASSKDRKTTKRCKRYVNPVLPFSRRNRLPWTGEEELILKDAVQSFSERTEGNLPWTEILEYGKDVFHKTRQPADLKDKWRNIRIKESKVMNQ